MPGPGSRYLKLGSGSGAPPSHGGSPEFQPPAAPIGDSAQPGSAQAGSTQPGSSQVVSDQSGSGLPGSIQPGSSQPADSPQPADSAQPAGAAQPDSDHPGAAGCACPRSLSPGCWPPYWAPLYRPRLGSPRPAERDAAPGRDEGPDGTGPPALGIGPVVARGIGPLVARGIGPLVAGGLCTGAAGGIGPVAGQPAPGGGIAPGGA